MASAPDIITFVGVPLAVLGVLPIIYNTTITLSALAKVKRILKKSRLAAITHADVVNNVIEVEFPRFQIAPLDREEDHHEYWCPYEHPSLVPGGSWTIFNWKLQTVGLKTQRIKYADELRQPQADIGFEELISYLLDLGAVPNAAGFRMLRSSGLWVPTGTPLLLSPDRHETALAIAPLNDSDGHLSLRVHWSRMWKMRDKMSLPPYWIRISGPNSQQVELDQSLVLKHKDSRDTDPLVAEIATEQSSRANTGFSESKNDSEFDAMSSSSTIRRKNDSVRCHISMDGLHEVVPEHSDHSASQQLTVEHLRIHEMSSTTTGVWFASTATALGASIQTVLWNYHIPKDLLEFARKDTIPCGILVLVGIINESQTPEWATKYDDAVEERELKFKQMRERTQAVMKENMLPTAEREKAVRERAMKQHLEFADGLRAKQRREAQRAETRMIEALQSPKWDNKLVAEHCLAWLKANEYIIEGYSVKRAVEVLLFKMIRDKAFAADITKMLDAWKGWVDGGGMSKANQIMIAESKSDFAYASLVLSIIRDSVTAADGSLAMDLQESVRIWKRVRLG